VDLSIPELRNLLQIRLFHSGRISCGFELTAVVAPVADLTLPQPPSLFSDLTIPQPQSLLKI
jgi:hypothetical protein